MPRVLADHARVDGRVPERRSDLPQRLLAVERGDVRPRPLSAAARAAASTFTKAGLVKVYCHIHSHMSATILVLDHPYFTIPDLDGTFDAAERPAGRLHARRLARARRRTDRARCASKRGQDGDRSTCRCRSRTRDDAGRASRRAAGQDAGRHLRHRVRCCWSSSSSSSPSACAIRCGSRSPPISNRASACSRRSRRGGSASCAAQAATLAENPTLKAALDTYAAEVAPTGGRRRQGAAARRRSTRELAEGRRAHRGRRDRRWSTRTRTRSPPPGRLAIAGRAAGRSRSSASRGGEHVRRHRAPRRRRRSASSPCRCCSSDGTHDRHAVPRDQPRSRATPTSSAQLAGTRTRSSATACWWRARSRRRAAREFEAAVAQSTGRPTAPSTLDGESLRVPAAVSRSATRASTRSARSTSRRGRRCGRRCAASAFIARRRDRSSRCSAASGWRGC